MLRLRSAVALLGLAMLLTVALGGPAFAATRSVSEVDFDFVPATLTINVGDTVVWTNNGAAPHTSTSDSGVWSSGTMDPGDTFSHTFSTAGTFAYHCEFHQSLGMVGTIVVQAGGGGTGGSTLPSTGASNSTIAFVWVGLLFLISGGAVLFFVRRRRA